MCLHKTLHILLLYPCISAILCYTCQKCEHIEEDLLTECLMEDGYCAASLVNNPLNNKTQVERGCIYFSNADLEEVDWEVTAQKACKADHGTWKKCHYKFCQTDKCNSWSVTEIKNGDRFSKCYLITNDYKLFCIVLVIIIIFV